MTGSDAAHVLLARLRGTEPPRIRDLRPGQPFATSDEQQPRLHPLDLGLRSGDQAESVEQFTGGEVCGAPERVLGKVCCSRRCGGGTPRAGIEVIGTHREDAVLCVGLSLRPLLIGMVGSGEVMLAFHASHPVTINMMLSIFC